MAITVLVEAESKDLTTLALVKTFLGITVNTYDSLLGFLIGSASAAIVDYCQREFAEESIEEIIEGSGMTSIMLTRTPIIEVTAVSYNGTALDLSADNIRIENADAGLLYREAGFWSYSNAVPGLIDIEKSPNRGKAVWTFEYKAGYSLPSFSTPGDGADLPKTIQQATIDTVITWYKSKDRDQSIQSERIADIYQVSYAAGTGSTLSSASRLPETVRGMLATYIRLL